MDGSSGRPALAAEPDGTLLATRDHELPSKPAADPTADHPAHRIVSADSWSTFLDRFAAAVSVT